jgi:hypothetical protein
VGGWGGPKTKQAEISEIRSKWFSNTGRELTGRGEFSCQSLQQRDAMENWSNMGRPCCQKRKAASQRRKKSGLKLGNVGD